MNAQTEIVDQFDAWRRAHATGTRVEWDGKTPSAGYYRRSRRAQDRSLVYDAVGIWFEFDEWQCVVTGGFRPTHSDEIVELFAGCNSTPISYELYETIANGGPWPEYIVPVETAPDLAPHEAAAAELKAQQDAAKAWALALGGKPATQEQADKAANYAEAFGKIEKSSDKARTAEKEPHLEAGRAVDAKWKPITEGAALAKKWAKNLSEDYARAEAARRQREADDANRKARAEYEAAKARADQEAALAAKGVAVPQFAPPPEPPKVIAAEPVKLGMRSRRQSLRKVTWEITDSTAMLKFLAERNAKSDALLAAALADAKTLMAAGIEVPGVVKGEREEIV